MYCPTAKRKLAHALNRSNYQAQETQSNHPHQVSSEKFVCNYHVCPHQPVGRVLHLFLLWPKASLDTMGAVVAEP